MRAGGSIMLSAYCGSRTGESMGTSRAWLDKPHAMKPLEQWVKVEARALGFDACRIALPDAIPEAPERLARALADGHLDGMGWMAETQRRRADPRALWPDVRSVIMLGTNYGPRSDPLASLARPSHGAISVYARHRDYHDVIKGRLKTLAQKIGARAGRTLVTDGGRPMGTVDAKVFVDTAPLMEKPLAEAAGLGWQGKHTNLVSRDFGSWLFLGSILTTLPLTPDAAERDHCGSCRRCLDRCPTDAFPAPYRLDARRCISYLTIEHDGPIPREFREPMGNRVYGCDDCLAVCPWNRFAKRATDAKLAEPEGWCDPPLAELLALDDAKFRRRFSGSPIKRIGRDRMVRNAAIAAGNSADPTLIPGLVLLLADASPTVRGAAVWALSRLSGDAAFHALRERHLRTETDGAVRAEWLGEIA